MLPEKKNKSNVDQEQKFDGSLQKYMQQLRKNIDPKKKQKFQNQIRGEEGAAWCREQDILGSNYFLLRPGEYANASGDAKHPFNLKDVQFKIGNTHFFDVTTCTFDQLRAATYVSLTFTTQKNGVKGEKLAHTSNGQPQACPVRSTLRQVLHFLHHHAPVTTPNHVYFDNLGRKRSVLSAMITSLLCAATLTIPGYAGVNPDNIAARLLCSSGAMALLLGGMDPYKIRIVGSWKSDAMF